MNTASLPAPSEVLCVGKWLWIAATYAWVLFGAPRVVQIVLVSGLLVICFTPRNLAGLCEPVDARATEWMLWLYMQPVLLLENFAPWLDGLGAQVAAYIREVGEQDYAASKAWAAANGWEATVQEWMRAR